MDPTPTELVCAHSPDADDAFMFYGLATAKIRSRLLRFRHVLEDIESLNRKAMEGHYEVTAISFHAYPYVADKYVLMRCGSSVGDGYGPVVVAARPISADELKGRRVAVPGRLTTGYLVLKLFEPDLEAVELPFDRILDAVRDRTVDAGVVIHEGQLTYAGAGLHAVVDLGRWWKEKYGLPLPLGANALLRSLSGELQQECCRLMRQSIQYAFEHHSEALAYALQFARDLDAGLAEQFVGMYVNQYTVDCGSVIPEAAQKLLDLGYEAGLIPRRATVEFVS